ncbi:hypothetical protein [Ruminococcus sp. FC2018]|uniref:hypothetical protein n=1 Tax=Ruminococcus sp. FC2018 TaxID=1410617 RepID=UPI000A9AE79A|nr:hypothetical protein [Ruminococcus sp. FC2018]
MRFLPTAALCKEAAKNSLKTEEKIPFKYAVISALTALVYGAGCSANFLVNGKGEIRPAL